MYKFLFVLLLAAQGLFAQNPCKIQNLRIEQTACNDEGIFYVYLVFERQNTSGSFLVLGNGKNYGTFPYQNAPVKIGPLKADCTTEYEFLVKDAEFPDCQAFAEMGKKCCAVHCNIYVDSIVSTCHDATLDMAIAVSRPAKNTGNFKLKINGEAKGTFPLGGHAIVNGIPIDPLEPVMEIIACLVDSETCCDTFQYVNPCFCSITGFKTQVLDCNPEDSTFSVKINFTGTEVGDSFMMGGNNTTYGIFAYNQLPVTITGLKFSDTEFYEFLVIDQNSAVCFGAYELGIVDSCRFNCHIHTPTVEVLPCTEDGKFFARLQFTEENTGHGGFRVRGNGHIYGEFDYGQHYYDIGPLDADCSTLYEFVVRDIETESCQNVVHLEEPVCCQEDCFIREVSVTENCLDDILISYVINFDHNQDSTKIFGVWANGVKVGNYSFGDLPVTIQNITFDGTTVNFLVVNLSNDNCRKEFTREFVCATGHGEGCKIQVTGKERGECTEDGTFYVFFSIRTENHGNHGFKVTSPQANYVAEFQYGQNSYKIGPFEGDCETKYTFILQDIAKPDCKADFGLETPVCCDGHEACYIRDVSITEICDGDRLTAYKINFDHNQDSTKIFGVWANGVKVGEFHFGQLPITIQNITFNTRVVVFKIIALPNEACRKEIMYEFDCLPGNGGNCQLDIEAFEHGECQDNGEFFIFFKLKATNPGNQGFKVYSANNLAVTSFAYGQTTYKIGPFAGDCVTKYRFLIKDVAHPDCATEFGLAEAVCCSKACSIDSIRIEKTECINGLVAVTLNFNHFNTTGSFTLKLNGTVRGIYNYQDLPIVIRQLETKTTYKIFIQDNEKDCIEDFSFQTPECASASEDEFWKGTRVFVSGEELVIKVDQPVNSTLSLGMTDLLGRHFHDGILTSGENRLNLSGFPSGLYLVTLTNRHFAKSFKVVWHR